MILQISKETIYELFHFFQKLYPKDSPLFFFVTQPICSLKEQGEKSLDKLRIKKI